MIGLYTALRLSSSKETMFQTLNGVVVLFYYREDVVDKPRAKVPTRPTFWAEFVFWSIFLDLRLRLHSHIGPKRFQFPTEYVEKLKVEFLTWEFPKRLVSLEKFWSIFLSFESRLHSHMDPKGLQFLTEDVNINENQK